MIHKWLLKHRWVNELGKTIMGCLAAYFAFVVYQAASLATLDFSDTTVAFRPLISFGMVIGVSVMVAGIFFSNVVFSVVSIIRNRNGREET